MGQGQKLSRADWAQAALAAIARGGLAAVAVEPLAALLGTTKGSFYWHFANREALVEAALQLWEARGTEDVIAVLEAEPDPEARLRRLFGLALEAARRDSTELRLLANADHPQVASALRRVTERRVGYLTRLYAELGFPPGAARQRALLTYCAYLGHAQLAHAVPQVLPDTDGEWQRYLDDPLTALLRRD